LTIFIPQISIFCALDVFGGIAGHTTTTYRPSHSRCVYVCVLLSESRDRFSRSYYSYTSFFFLCCLSVSLCHSQQWLRLVKHLSRSLLRIMHHKALSLRLAGRPGRLSHIRGVCEGVDRRPPCQVLLAKSSFFFFYWLIQLKPNLLGCKCIYLYPILYIYV
jgi:hypothetical protein